MEVEVGRQDGPRLQRILAAIRVGDHAAGLGDHQKARGDVPLAQAALPVAVEAAGGDIGQVQGRRAEPANARNLLRHLMQFLQEGRVSRPAHERNACRQHRLAQVPPGSDAQALVVDEAALALLGPEQLVGDGIVGDAGDDLAFALQGHGAGEVRNGVQEVGCAVEGVGDPGVGLVGALDHPPLLAEEAIAGPGRGQGLEQHLLGLDVGGGDVVCGSLLGDLQFAKFAKVPRQALCRLADGVAHDFQQGGLGGHVKDLRWPADGALAVQRPAANWARNLSAAPGDIKAQSDCAPEGQRQSRR